MPAQGPDDGQVKGRRVGSRLCATEWAHRLVRGLNVAFFRMFVFLADWFTCDPARRVRSWAKDDGRLENKALRWTGPLKKK